MKFTIRTRSPTIISSTISNHNNRIPITRRITPSTKLRIQNKSSTTNLMTIHTNLRRRTNPISISKRITRLISSSRPNPTCQLRLNIRPIIILNLSRSRSQTKNNRRPSKCRTLTYRRTSHSNRINLTTTSITMGRRILIPISRFRTFQLFTTPINKRQNRTPNHVPPKSTLKRPNLSKRPPPFKFNPTHILLLRRINRRTRLTKHNILQNLPKRTIYRQRITNRTRSLFQHNLIGGTTTTLPQFLLTRSTSFVCLSWHFGSYPPSIPTPSEVHLTRIPVTTQSAIHPTLVAISTTLAITTGPRSTTATQVSSDESRHIHTSVQSDEAHAISKGSFLVKLSPRVQNFHTVVTDELTKSAQIFTR